MTDLPRPPALPDPARRDATWTWRRDVATAGAGTLAALPGVLTQGLLAYAALGAAGPALGIPAALVSVVLGGAVFAWLARGPMPAGGPTSAQVLILAALVAQVVADPAFDPSRPAAIAELLVLTAIAVVAMGLLMIGIALSGGVKLAQFVPQPVLAGFMNGVALLIVLTQVPLVLGWPEDAWSRLGLAAFGSTQAATLAVAAVTVAAILLAPRIAPRWPANFIGLAVGVCTYFAFSLAWPAWPIGPLTGDLPLGLPRPQVLLPLIGGDPAGLVASHLGSALTTAVLLALTGTLAMVLDGLALDQALQTRTDARRELLALGTANVASGLFGGLPVLLHYTRALAGAQVGGRARPSLLIGAALFAVLGTVGSPLLALLPKVVLAGVMVAIAWTLLDRWTYRLLAQWWAGQRTADLQLNLAVVAAVSVGTIAFGLAAGVALGALLSATLFIHSMNSSLLRGRHTAADQPSRRIWLPAQEAALRGLRDRIVVLELEGALFFGSADRLAAEAESLPASCRSLVLDFRRVSVIDASGAVVLSQVAQRLQARGITLRLAGVAAGQRHGQAVREFAGTALPPSTWFVDVDQAVEAAEQQLLSAHAFRDAPAPPAVALANSSLMTGLDAAQCERVAARMTRQRLAAGEVLFRQGDPGDRLYVVTEGSISIIGASAVADGDRSGRRTPGPRYVSLSPGMMLGETALLDGLGRSADAIADRPSEVHALTGAVLEALIDEDPAMGARVHRNIALHLAQRLRAAASTWRSSGA